MQQIKIEVTEQDILSARQYDINNPIICALLRVTGSLWQMSECGVVLEVAPPHRTFVLSEEALEYWQAYQTTGMMPCFEFVAREFHLTTARQINEGQ